MYSEGIFVTEWSYLSIHWLNDHHSLFYGCQIKAQPLCSFPILNLHLYNFIPHCFVLRISCSFAGLLDSIFNFIPFIPFHRHFKIWLNYWNMFIPISNLCKVKLECHVWFCQLFSFKGNTISKCMFYGVAHFFLNFLGPSMLTGTDFFTWCFLIFSSVLDQNSHHPKHVEWEPLDVSSHTFCWC